ARPGGAAPPIFVQTTTDETRLHFPHYGELSFAPWDLTVEIALRITEPGGDGSGLWLGSGRGRALCFTFDYFGTRERREAKQDQRDNGKISTDRRRGKSSRVGR